MKNPRIYSLSTVGVLKHYIHDYLLHQERTDFVGANGVGKSIIADLLQLMFVYDTSLIRFGTDGLNKKERSIYSLPYRQPYAFCFLNIEIRPSAFLTIGIQLPSRTGSRITPFAITASSNLKANFDEVSLTVAQLLFAEDFTNDLQLLDLQTLTEKLYDRGLYLTTFRTKDEVRTYYQFLYDQHITPINLVISENLSAFAKVIQSFSKAKSLDLNNSNSIKQFLFDDADKDFVSDYDKQKALLEKLLKDYEELTNYIEQLDKKQGQLTVLKSLEMAYLKSRRTFKNCEMFEAAELVAQLKKAVSLQEKQYKISTAEQLVLQNRLDMIPDFFSIMNTRLTEARSQENLLSNYERKNNRIEDLTIFIDQLQVWKHLEGKVATMKGVEPQSTIDVDVDKMIALASYVHPFITKYGDIQSIEDIYVTQLNRLNKIEQQLTNDVSHHQRWLGLLENSNNSSLLNWTLEKGYKLTTEQEAVVMRFFDAGTNQPGDPTVQNQFVDLPDFLDQMTYIADNTGFWLSLGHLHQHIELEPSQQKNQGALPDREKLQTQKRQLIVELELKKKVLGNIRQGQPYDRNVLNEEFDLEIIEYSNVKKMKTALSYIADIGSKIRQLEIERDGETKLLNELRYQITGNYDIVDFTELHATLSKTIAVKEDICRKITKAEGRYEESLKGKSKSISDVALKIKQGYAEIDDRTLFFEGLSKAYYLEYKENIGLDELSAYTTPVGTAEKLYKESRDNYWLKYAEAMHLFPETINRRSISVNLEVDNKTYGFRPLEEALLGGKIDHTEEIGVALSKANADRLIIADNIRDGMAKIFNRTIAQYQKYDQIVKSINAFFKLRKISNRFIFHVNFQENKPVSISYLQHLSTEINAAYKRNEIPMGYPINEVIESIFKKSAGLSSPVKVNDLLNPKTYFELSVSLNTENQERTSGSTGETYSAIALLGIARLSLVEKDQREGLRFIILEETGSLDNINFSTFPAIAKEYGYQIITMAPRPFGITLSEEWYLHYLIKGRDNEDINHHPTASFYYSKDKGTDLHIYLSKQKLHELD